uniref:Uncharacterized protein n=1 Tax=Oryza brachyantha TaxID=4533 RepID=J3LC78_ORYBR
MASAGEDNGGGQEVAALRTFVVTRTFVVEATSNFSRSSVKTTESKFCQRRDSLNLANAITVAWRNVGLTPPPEIKAMQPHVRCQVPPELKPRLGGWRCAESS